MKKLTLLLVSFFAVFALGLTGCSDDPDVKQETPVIKASNPADIAAVAGKVTVPYTVDYAVDGCSLDVTWDATWLHDLSVSADKFTLQADANPGAAREAKLTLTYPEATSVELTVRQMSASESISISPKTLSFSYKGGEETVTVTSSKSWTLEERIAQRDAKIDALYVELRNEQSDKLAWIHKCHELELQLKDAEHNRCDRPDSECGRRIPPRRATLIKDKEEKK